MYRKIINEFISWYEMEKNKILYVKGAKGVGKTWSVKDFASAYFDKYYIMDLSINTAIAEEVSKDSLWEDFDFLIDEHFDYADLSEGLLIFDEVQVCSNSGFSNPILPIN